MTPQRTVKQDPCPAARASGGTPRRPGLPPRPPRAPGPGAPPPVQGRRLGLAYVSALQLVRWALWLCLDYFVFLRCPWGRYCKIVGREIRVMRPRNMERSEEHQGDSKDERASATSAGGAPRTYGH